MPSGATVDMVCDGKGDTCLAYWRSLKNTPASGDKPNAGGCFSLLAFNKCFA